MISIKLKELRRERKITLEALAEAIGTSKQTVHRYENGIITNIPASKIEAMAHALGVTPTELMGWDNGKAGASSCVPLLGEISCGSPIFASEERGEYFSASCGVEADFCLRAHGDSMIGARIYDGDIVFIRSGENISDGDICAVVIEDEATLKRVYYHPEEGKLILSPENPRYAPLVYTGEELSRIKILGKAVAFQSVII